MPKNLAKSHTQLIDSYHKNSMKGSKMTTLSEACTELQKQIDGTGIAINFDSEDQVSIYWHGVIQLDCTPALAAKATPLFKKLHAMGAADC